MNKAPEVNSKTALSNSSLGNLIQVCLVTRDHRKAIDGMVRLGLGPWTIRTFDSSNLTETTFRGKPTKFSMKVCLANSPNMNWEIIEPIDGPSIYTDFLERHGDGVQHLGFNCNGVACEEKLRHFAGLGYEAVQTGVYMGKVRLHYFATENDARTIIEVFDFHTDFSFPAPEAWIPGPPPS
jgi:glyoxalase/bleomycin resistance protein/dioxygenase superfamily protein